MFPIGGLSAHSLAWLIWWNGSLAGDRPVLLPNEGALVPSLIFEVQDVAAIPFAAAPMLGFQLRIGNRSGDSIQAANLRCQIQIEPARRRYTPQDQERLLDLFGEASRWGQTLRTMLWTHA